VAAFVFASVGTGASPVQSERSSAGLLGSRHKTDGFCSGMIERKTEAPIPNWSRRSTQQTGFQGLLPCVIYRPLRCRNWLCQFFARRALYSPAYLLESKVSGSLAKLGGHMTPTRL